MFSSGNRLNHRNSINLIDLQSIIYGALITLWSEKTSVPKMTTYHNIQIGESIISKSVIPKNFFEKT
uniref:Uncharacterized protein n=1 Tax=Solanum lycopersicum TaxID=4081 RepID=A0A3Q7I1T3_SOLLC